MPHKLTPMYGTFSFPGENLVQFKGRAVNYFDSADSSITHTDGADSGLVLADEEFSGGTISAKITFPEVTDRTQAGIVLWSDPSTSSYIAALISRAPGGGPLFVVRHWNGKVNADFTGASGEGTALREGHQYEIQVKLQGSSVSMIVDGIHVVKTTIMGGLRAGVYRILCKRVFV